ncbi:cyclase family protein [Breznakiella homolactica]|uniref:Cyclase family protein n=1 Tax=Breznakiella homolactica TaxID=2798577 RepID=A0A7T7XQM8_9SPIR|nr:cyclase family protein [Breznakiella homolactica]QQO10688.1 cyclase family protein [Breznakiella homolactica]
MKRIIDLSMRPLPAPVGNGEALVRPSLSVVPQPELLREPVSKERSMSEILSYYEFNHVMSGVQAGEIFTKGILTTKPYTTCATYYNGKFTENRRPQYLADLTSDHLVGHYTLIDLSDSVQPKTVITADMLKAVMPKKKAERILVIRTGYSKNRPAEPSEKYLTDSPVLSADAAELIAASGVYSVAIDIRCMDGRYTGASGDNIHGILNSNGILVVEDLTNLQDIKPSHDWIFIGIPLPIRGVSGGAARVFAVNMKKPTDFVDCSHELESYPDNPYDYDLPFEPPVTKRRLDEFGDYPNVLPGRIEPREIQGITQKTARLTPFSIVNDKQETIANEMYMEYGHGTGTHIEAAFYDPWGRHCVPEEVLKRYVRIPRDRLVANACLLDLSTVVGPNQMIDSTHLRDADPGLKKGDIAVIRADYCDWFFYGTVSASGPGLSPDAGMYLLEKGIRALVCDFAVEKSDPVSSNPAIKYTPNKVHYLLHKNDIPVVEWVCNLKLIKKKQFTMAICCLPASHQGGFPAHVFAVEDWA